MSLTRSWFLKKEFLRRPLPALTDIINSTKSYKNTSRSMIHCFESDSAHIPKTVQCMVDRAVNSNALSKTRVQDLSLDLPKSTCLTVDLGLELAIWLLSFYRRYSCISTCGSEREWAGVRGSEREWAGVSRSEREWAGVSAEIDRRMTNTDQFKNCS